MIEPLSIAAIIMLTDGSVKWFSYDAPLRCSVDASPTPHRLAIACGDPKALVVMPDNDGFRIRNGTAECTLTVRFFADSGVLVFVGEVVAGGGWWTTASFKYDGVDISARECSRVS